MERSNGEVDNGDLIYNQEYKVLRKIDKNRLLGNSLAVQWLGLHAPTAGGTGSIPSWGTKSPHATEHSQKKEDKT